MFTTQLEALKGQLQSAIDDDRIIFKPLKTDKGSYAIKFPPNHRIARFVYIETKKVSFYKCVCDDDLCKEIFDKIGVKYKDRPGYRPDENKKESKILYLNNIADTREFLLDVTREYIRLNDNN